jgi:1-acyl-sn-glycerol-3-phosphate acyltransferase
MWPSLRRPLRAVSSVGWTAALVGVANLRQRVARRRRPEAARAAVDQAIFDEIVQTWARGVLRLAGVRLVIEGTVPRPRPFPPAANDAGREPGAAGAGGPALLVVANHRTALDIPVLLSLFRGSVLSRGDLQHWPLLGHAAKRAQTIFVGEAGDRVAGARAIRQMRTHLQQGRTVCVFPEGTTVAGDAVLPFQAGAFVAARGLDVHVVPVGLAWPGGVEYTESEFLAHVNNVAGKRRIPVAAVIGEARPLAAIAEKTETIATRMRDEVQTLVERARALQQAHAAQRRGRATP